MNKIEHLDLGNFYLTEAGELVYTFGVNHLFANEKIKLPNYVNRKDVFNMLYLRVHPFIKKEKSIEELIGKILVYIEEDEKGFEIVNTYGGNDFDYYHWVKVNPCNGLKSTMSRMYGNMYKKYDKIRVFVENRNLFL